MKYFNIGIEIETRARVKPRIEVGSKPRSKIKIRIKHTLLVSILFKLTN